MIRIFIYITNIEKRRRKVKRFNHKVTAAIMSAILTASALVGCGQTAGSSATDDSAKNETVAVTNETYAANETKDEPTAR